MQVKISVIALESHEKLTKNELLFLELVRQMIKLCLARGESYRFCRKLSPILKELDSEV